ncbi:MAG: sigma-54 dependent transcriptional regulator [Desulfobacterales bacterium]|nr:sigma-54 dependent transcriptional regulator [Desulfobacterales bacterium]
MNETLLIVDDDPSILAVLEARLSAGGYHVLKAASAAEAGRILKAEAVDLMVSDIKMPQKSGMEFFRENRKRFSHLPVIFLTAYGTIPDAVEAMKMGAVDYLSKPFDGRMLMEKIQDTLAAVAKGTSSPKKNSDAEGYYWGESPAMERLHGMVSRIAPTRVNVLIIGESGVGKEGLARYIHDHSTRASRPYGVVDCGATPPGILESELFGHLKGAFTHAVKDKKGLIQAAHQGTLFLDEMGNISHDMQCRLLRFLENGKIRQVGAVSDTVVDCRVVAATNADLPSEIEAGRFRRDLYYRLKGVVLTLPPLRERVRDIPVLARRFMDGVAQSQNLGPVDLAPDALERLLAHGWPGNIRELKNVVETGALLCRDGIIRAEDLQIEAPRQSGQGDVSQGFSIQESERQTLIRALEQTRGVQKHAADLLGISKRAMHYKVKKYGIYPGDYK